MDFWQGTNLMLTLSLFPVSSLLFFFFTVTLHKSHQRIPWHGEPVMFHCFLYGSCKGQSSSKVIPYTCSNSSSKSVLIVVAGLTGPLTVENPGQSQMVWVDLVKPNAAAPNHVGPWSNILESSGKGRTAQAHIWIFFFAGPHLDFFFRRRKTKQNGIQGQRSREERSSQPD